MDGAEELSPHLPRFLRPFHFILILLILILLALIQRGSPRTTPFQSVIHLVVLDTYTYLLFLFTAVLLLIAIIYTPHQTISISVVAPALLLLGLFVYAKKTQPARRTLYALWLSVESMCCVTDLVVDMPALIYAGKILVSGNHAHSSLKSLSSESHIRHLPSTVRTGDPFFTALRTHHLHSRKYIFPSQQPPTPFCKLLSILQHSRQHLTQRSCHYVYTENMRFITSWHISCRLIPHKRFAALWHRVTSQTSIDKHAQGAWFIGAEIVQSLKHSFGLDYISADNHYDNIDAMWNWVSKCDLSFRKRLQIPPVAEEIARERGGVVKNAVLYANALAGEGKPGVVVPTGLDKRIAVEANVVAVLGMIVQKVHRTLDVTRLWQRVMTLFASDTWLNHRLVMRPLDSWPRRELAEIIVSWIMEASDQTIDSNESCHESLSRS